MNITTYQLKNLLTYKLSLKVAILTYQLKNLLTYKLS